MGIFTGFVKALTGAGNIAEAVGKYAEKRLEVKAQKEQFASQERMKVHELKMAQLERQTRLHSEGLTADANWEMEFAKQAASSWKDEYVLIVLSIPAVGCFIPGLDIYVAKGFAALGATPMWYQLVFTCVFLATYGIRYWRRTQSDT